MAWRAGIDCCAQNKGSKSGCYVHRITEGKYIIWVDGICSYWTQPPWHYTRGRFTAVSDSWLESGFDYNPFSLPWFLREICFRRMVACSAHNQELQRKVFQLEKCNMWENHLFGNLHNSIQAPEIELFPPLSPSLAPWWNNCVGSRRWSWTDPTNRPRLGPAFWWG